ncbi:MAG TPA: OmpH family outer membrane protein [Rhabdochlamydiaceae bacterium]|jgi:outer membrane protein|nr:OmpH family outer membrane protein [Rhabdochlamydiaceae bacterium]
MKKRYLVTAFILAGLQLCAAEQKVGIVNMENVFMETKLGKQEQTSFETMRKQFATLIEDTEKQLRDLNEKLSDKDTLDGLSPEAEAEMKNKFAQLSEEMNRYQQQYYQFIQQGQSKMIQAIHGGITHASEKLAAAKGYSMILNKQACFYSAPTLDVTNDMIKEMDKNFEDDAKKQAAAAPATAPVATAPVEAKKEEAKQTAAAPKEEQKTVVEAKKAETKSAAPKAEEKKSAGTDATKSK